jgi:hypothetical protein
MAYGAFRGGSGSTSSPYQIEDAHDLFQFCNSSSYNNKYAILVNDIDMDVMPFNSGDGWKRTADFEFYGGLDGKGYCIYNMKMSGSDNRRGLFYQLNSNAYVRNIGFINPNVDCDNNYIALIAVYLYYGTIENCFVKGGYFKATGYAAPIVAYVNDSNNNYSYIVDCYVEDTEIYCGGNYIGGLVGFFSSDNTRVERCWVSVDILNIASTTYNAPFIGRYNSSNTSFFQYNFFDYSRLNSDYNGYSWSSSHCTRVTTADLKSIATFVPAYTNENYSSKRRWVIREGSFPRLYFHPTNRMYLLESNIAFDEIYFGLLTAGMTSAVKTIKIKNGYGATIKDIKVSWSRADGVSEFTNLEINSINDFTNISNPFIIENVNLEKGEETTIYMRCVTDEELETEGRFNITVEVTIHS